MTQFVKTLDGKPIERLLKLLPWLTKLKVVAGVFNGPEVDKILDDKEFFNALDRKHRIAFQAMNDVIKNFLGNRRADNYVDLVRKMIISFKNINANMSTKLHFLHNHLNDFAENCGDYSDQHGEKFHQDIKRMEKRYGGKDLRKMLADHCWTLIRESDNYETKWSRKVTRTYFKIEKNN